MPATDKVEVAIERDSHYHHPMYVCICHGLTDTDVASAEESGAVREADVFCHYGVKPQCGKCISSMRCLMKCSRAAAVDKPAEQDSVPEFLPRRLAFQG